MKRILICLLLGTGLSAQDWGQHFGLNLYATQPSDTAAKIYERGYKIAVPFYFRVGNPVEQRLRVEFGKFSRGKVQVVTGWGETEQVNATTRLVGYDWLVSLGARKEAGVDLILGIGGASWYQDGIRTYPNDPAPGVTTTTYTETKAAFEATVGFRFRFTRNLALELHQVFTSLPGSDRDFKDAELSHTALGLAFRL